jgi:hypothetical protein
MAQPDLDPMDGSGVGLFGRLFAVNVVHVEILGLGVRFGIGEIVGFKSNAME